MKKFIKSWGPVLIFVAFIRSFVVEAFMVPTGSMEDTILIGDFMLVTKFNFGIKLPFTTKTIIPTGEPKKGEIVVFRYPLDPDSPQPEERYVRIFPKFLPLLPIYWSKDKNFFHWYAPRNFVKRCVAVEGETVTVRNKVLYVNGKTLPEPYALHKDNWLSSGLNIDSDSFQKLWEEGLLAERIEVRDNFGPVVVPKNCIFAMGDNRDNSADSRFFGPLDKKYLKGKPLLIYFSSAAAPNLLRIILSPGSIRWERVGRLVR
ncbi:MAG: signal peptidase I [candidate division WOR-3 bacterium]